MLHAIRFWRSGQECGITHIQEAGDIDVVIGERFVWAHFPKTAGDSTHALFAQLGIDLQVDDTRTPEKHESFAVRERKTGLDLTHSRRRIMNIRRLPAWLLSHAKHLERNCGYPVDTDRLRSGQFASVQGLNEAQRLANVVCPLCSLGITAVNRRLRPRLIRMMTSLGPPRPADVALQAMMSGRVDDWIRQECLVEDFLRVVRDVSSITTDIESAIRSTQPRNAGHYDRDLAQWFSPDDLVSIYGANPIWAKIERRVYGNTLIDGIDTRLVA